MIVLVACKNEDTYEYSYKNEDARVAITMMRFFRRSRADNPVVKGGI